MKAGVPVTAGAILPFQFRHEIRQRHWVAELFQLYRVLSSNQDRFQLILPARSTTVRAV
jgi:hypothetical protein